MRRDRRRAAVDPRPVGNHARSAADQRPTGDVGPGCGADRAGRKGSGSHLRAGDTRRTGDAGFHHRSCAYLAAADKSAELMSTTTNTPLEALPGWARELS